MDLVEVTASSGIRGPGSWLCGRDRGGVLEFQFFLSGLDGHRLQMQPQSPTGKTPAEVLPALRLAADLRRGTGLQAAIRAGGQPVTPVWELEDEPMAPAARWHVRLVEALAAIQQHSYHRIAVPNLDTTPKDELDAILHTGRLLHGEHVNATWSEVTLTVASRDRLPSGVSEFALAAVFPMTVRLNGHELTLNMHRRVLYRSARVAEPALLPSVQAGQTLRLVPGSTDQAIMAAIPPAEPAPHPLD